PQDRDSAPLDRNVAALRSTDGFHAHVEQLAELGGGHPDRLAHEPERFRRGLTMLSEPGRDGELEALEGLIGNEYLTARVEAHRWDPCAEDKLAHRDRPGVVGDRS